MSPRGATTTRDSVTVEAALLVASLASGLGALRLTTSPAQTRLVFSVAATVVGGHLAVQLVQRSWRRHRPAGVALASGVVFVALVSSWISVPSATFYGIPTPSTVRALLHLFAQAGRIIRSHPTPLSATPGVLLCLISGAGLVSVFGRVLFGSTRSTTRSALVLVSLVPSFGLFAYTAVLSSGVDRVTGAIAYIAAACAFLVVADLPQSPSRAPGEQAFVTPRLLAVRRADGSSRVRVRTGIGAGLAAVATAAVLALALSPSLAGMRLDALPFSGGGAGTSGPAGAGAQGGSGGSGATKGSEAQGSIAVIDLIANLQGVLSSRSQQVMFDARSPVPTYWQVGTLTVFNGSQWTPDPDTARSSGQGPVDPHSTTDAPPLPVLPQPAVSSTYSAQVSLVGLGGRLLPVPPNTLSVSGGGTTLDPAIGALYEGSRAKQASSGLTYVAVAQTPPGASGADGNGTPSSSVTAGELAPYLALPASVPSVVVSIAEQVTAGAVGPAAKAEALAQWFDSGLFRYTLDPPPPAPGEDPLVSFLLVYRAGFCQQFAGAYAVLARSIGLPTRLAVGFATGVPVGNANKKAESAFGTTYRVTGADAHVWPEVYLGARAGWVSFEPTPSSSNEPSPVGVVEGNPGPASISAPPPTSTTQVGSAGSAERRSARLGSARHANLWGHLAWGVVWAVFLAAVASAVVLLRRSSLFARLRLARSRRPRRDAGTNGRVLSRLDRASRGLRRAGLGRWHTETLEEHVARLRDGEATEGLLQALAPYEELTLLAERACYSPDPCTEADVTEAARLCELVTSSLRPRRSSAAR